MKIARYEYGYWKFFVCYAVLAVGLKTLYVNFVGPLPEWDIIPIVLLGLFLMQLYSFWYMRSLCTKDLRPWLVKHGFKGSTRFAIILSQVILKGVYAGREMEIVLEHSAQYQNSYVGLTLQTAFPNPVRISRRAGGSGSTPPGDAAAGIEFEDVFHISQENSLLIAPAVKQVLLSSEMMSVSGAYLLCDKTNLGFYCKGIISKEEHLQSVLELMTTLAGAIERK